MHYIRSKEVICVHQNNKNKYTFVFILFILYTLYFILFSNDHTKYARDRWLKIVKELHISKIQIQRLMQNKKEFTSLLNKSYA